MRSINIEPVQTVEEVVADGRRSQLKRASEDELVVYRELMDVLDAAEETRSSLRYFVMAVELVVFSILLAALICSLTMDQINQKWFLKLRIWQQVTTVMIVFSGFSVIRFITFLLSLPVLWWWRIHKYVVYFVRELKSCADITLWLGVVFLYWCVWFRHRLQDVHVSTHHITRILGALSIGSFLWLLKNILYLKLEADLHYDQLFDRIKLSVMYLHAIQIIQTRGVWSFFPTKYTRTPELDNPMSTGTFNLVDYMESLKKGSIWMLVMAMKKEKVPIWVLRRLVEAYTDQVTFVHPTRIISDDIMANDDEQILDRATMLFLKIVPQHSWVGRTDVTYSDVDIERKDLAEGRYNLSEVELEIIFSPDFRLYHDDEYKYNPNEERTISYYEFMHRAVVGFKTCRALQPTMSGSKRVFRKLNRLMNFFLVMMVIIIWLLLSGLVNIGELVLLLTPLLAASFIFGDSCKKMFEGLVFAFGMHPFDIGDHVIINDVHMRVTELDILTSTFHKYGSEEKIIIPNSTLTTASIVNLEITPTHTDKVEFMVSAHTPLEDLKDLEIKIKRWLDYHPLYSPNNMVFKSDFGKEDIKIEVHFKYLVSNVSAESIARDKSKIGNMIMEYRNEMDQRTRENFSSYDLYRVDIEFSGKATVQKIDNLKKVILSGLEDTDSSFKVVFTDLTRSRVEIDVYCYSSDPTGVDREKRSGKEDESKNETDQLRKCANMEKVKKNLAVDVFEGLKRLEFVRDVNMFQKPKE